MNDKAFANILAATLALVGIAGCGRSPEASEKEYLAKADQLASAGRFRDASLNYRKALQVSPNSGIAYYRLGLSEQKQDNMIGAFQAFSRAMELLPDDDRPKIDFANLTLQRYMADPRHPSELLNHVERVGRQLDASNPQGFDTFRLKGYVSMLRGDSGTALRMFEKAVQLNGRDPEVRLALSECLWHQGRAADAERTALDLIQEQPHFGPIYDQLYSQYLTVRRNGDAEQVLRKKAASNPDDVSYKLQLATHYAKLGNESQVRQEVAAAERLSAQISDARVRVGDFYVKLGRLDDAIDQYRQGAAAGGPLKLVYQKRLTEALLNQGKDADAAKVVSGMLATHPDDPEVQIKHALVLLAGQKRESVEAAAVELGKLAKSFPNDANILYYLGRAQLALGRLGDANVAFLEAMRRRYDSVPVRLGLAEIALRVGAPKEAIRYTDEALRAQPTNIQARLIHATAATNLQEYAVAERELMKLLADHPGIAEAELQMGVVYIALKRFQDAERLFRTSRTKFRDDIRPIEGLVQTYAFQNQFDRAYGILQDGLASAPNSVQLRMLLANTAERAGQADMAAQQYRQILTANPSHVESYIRLAEISTRRENFAQAITELEHARTIAPNDARVAGLLGFAQERAGRTDLAMTSYRKSLELQPGNPAIQNNLAFLLAETGGDLEEAQRLIGEAVKRMPQNPTYVDTLGWVYLKRNMVESAVRVFQNLSQEHPAEASFRYHLAMSLLQTGNRAAAKAELVKALGQQPNNEYQAKIQRAIAQLS